MKTIVTILGIRPDFIRMAYTIRKLDNHFNHILIHTGQHYDALLSDVFFKELGIRCPDYILDVGKRASNHFEQLIYLTQEIPRLFNENNIRPDMILFLGDSNTVGVAYPLKKAGYCIGHIEAGMRSYDRRMLEEINRTVCDHCSDVLFVYHEDYKGQLELENITNNVFVVGNTVVEPILPVRDILFKSPKLLNVILMDIHRPENFQYEDRLRKIFKFANTCINTFGTPVHLLYFKRLQDSIDKYGISLGNIQMVPLKPYSEYLKCVYDAPFIISDSGTGQEEPALLNTFVIVPRDFTERPQSYSNGCSVQLQLESENFEDIFEKINKNNIRTDWLGDGTTSDKIISGLLTYMNNTNTA